MSDLNTPNGLDALRNRVERRQRSVPPPRRPRTDADETGAKAEPKPISDAVERADPDELRESHQAISTADPVATAPEMAERTGKAGRPAAQPGEMTANLAVRVRRSVDDRLADLVHQFRREGVRSSKAEVVEMLLWELPPVPTDELRARLAVFRDAAPREASLVPDS